MGYQQFRCIDILLLPVRQQNTEDPVSAQCLHTQRRHHGTVLAAADRHHRIAARSVLFKKVSYPLYDLILDTNRIEMIIIILTHTDTPL